MEDYKMIVGKIREMITEIKDMIPVPEANSTKSEINRIELQKELLEWQVKLEHFVNTSAFSKGSKKQASFTQINQNGDNYLQTNH